MKRNTYSSAVDSAALALPELPGSRAATVRSIDRQWSTICGRAARALGADSSALDALPAPRSILGSSHKAEIAEGASGALVAVSYLAPGAMLSRLAGVEGGATACPMAALNDCESGCLGGDNGRGQLSFPTGTARLAMLSRSALLLGAPKLFAELLAADCVRHARAARREGKRAFIRLDGTSDLGLATREGVLERLEGYGVDVYDYTKLVGRALNHGDRIAITFSATPRTIKAARAVLEGGGGIAVVCATKKNAAAYAATVDALRELAESTGSRFLEADESEPLERGPRTIRCLTAKAGSRKAQRELELSGLVFSA